MLATAKEDAKNHIIKFIRERLTGAADFLASAKSKYTSQVRQVQRGRPRSAPKEDADSGAAPAASNVENAAPSTSSILRQPKMHPAAYASGPMPPRPPSKPSVADLSLGRKAVHL